MEISKNNSNKISLLNLLLIVFVLLLHSYYTEASDYPCAMAIQRFTGTYGLTGVAVPMFYLLSGLLFFNGIKAVKDCLPKMRKRVRTLLVPYIIWNIIFVLWYVVLQSLPGVGGFINNDIAGKVCSPDIVSDIYELLWKPANFPLWFLRDLMIMVAVSPLLYYLVKYLKWFAPILLVLVSPFVSLIISPFFILGGCIAMHSSLEEVTEKLIGGGRFYVWISVMIYVANAVAQIFTDFHHPYISFVACLCGIITVWVTYDWIASKESLTSKFSSLNSILGYSFFIYLFHEPVFNIIKKLNLKILGVREWSLIILYLVNPIIMCVLAICVAKLLQRIVPKTYSILVGGR